MLECRIGGISEEERASSGVCVTGSAKCEMHTCVVPYLPPLALYQSIYLRILVYMVLNDSWWVSLGNILLSWYPSQS